MGCRLQKLMFPYEWLDSYEKLSHVGPVSYERFYSSLKPAITRDEYEQFLKLFKENDCTTMGDWLRVYNVADVAPFIELLRRWLSSTILIRLIYAKMRLASQAYQWHTCWTSPWKKTKGLSYIHQGAFVTCAEICDKSPSNVVVMVPWSTTKCDFIVLSQVNEISLTVNQFH